MFKHSTLVLAILPFLCSTSWAGSGTLSFPAGGYTNHGNWSANATVSPASWKPGDTVTIDMTLQQAQSHLQALAAQGINADSFILLVTAERTFDYAGHLHLPYDQYMSTLITPTGLPIEGGYQGAITTRFGQSFSTPFDQFVKMPVTALGLAPDKATVLLHASGQLPANLPPGVYRLRLDIGVAQGNSDYTMNGGTFAYYSTYYGTEPLSFVYSPLIPADGVTVAGVPVSGSTIQPRMPWVLLNNYNSNGYQGVIAEEDKPYFALSPRNMIQDDVILPRLGTNNQPTSYNLEPQLIANSKDPTIDIPWDYASGQISVAVTGPDGKTVSLGQYPFIRQNGSGPTTGKTALTNWVPPAYGQYTVTATGYIQDIYGNLRNVALRQEERERAPLARRAHQPDLAAQQPSDLATDRQPQAGAAVLAARAAVGLLERLEDDLLLVRRNPNAGVRDRECEHDAARLRLSFSRLQPSAAGLTESETCPCCVNLNAFDSRFLITC